MKTMGIFEIKTRLSQVCQDIAATAIHHGCVLATLNEKDFRQIPNLQV